ncbi:AfsR/SARP family transcriptional regulator [Pontivivens ytuae]|uniref:Bacterial transcriptional activator domain-containing protein n=1 Tax=Pontivivens ytuae TaxID=2789856 RepID=A0A7S9LQA9_9RHOB|nr:BTAD domain-containing putative transcriptional regulator [Pontivivens ytuae]QPH53334.1 hypothetical protein I0K15_16305 [Pontivivens ytuae]
MPAPRERIWGRIWHDQPDTQARKSLNTELWRLKSALGSAGASTDRWLNSDASMLALRCSNGGVEIDLVNFLGALRRDDGPEPLAEAVRAYRGEFARGLEADWIEEERRRLRTSYLRLLRRLAEAWRLADRLRDALETAEDLVRAEPFDEEARRLLIAIKIDSGDRAGALLQLSEVEAVWSSELGVTPAPETLALREACLEPRERGYRIEQAGPRRFAIEEAQRRYTVERLTEGRAIALHARISRMRIHAESLMAELAALDDALDDDLPETD